MEYGQTIVHPIALLFTTIMCITILFIKRENIIVPLILVACIMTQQQRIAIFGIDFSMLRITIIVGFLKIFLRNERSVMTFNSIDKAMLYFMTIKTMAYTILWASGTALVYSLGNGLDTIGAYFLIRLALSKLNDYDVIIKTIIVISIPIAVFMAIEQMTGGRNYFSIFGGVPEYDIIREGRLRAQGAFSHPILAGTFGALIPPLAWVIWLKNKKILALFGFTSALLITYASSSSGPIATFGAVCFGLFFWRFNKYTRLARRLFFLTLIVLHFSMKAPVWHLISRVDLVGGSTGYHRYHLIDAAVRNFFKWFIFGIRDTGSWGIGLQDLTNQYILEGARGGLITLILFIMIIVRCFQCIGTSRIKLEGKIKTQKYVWALGVVLFAHTITFISVSYFGQMVFFYYLLLAMISSLNNMPEIMNPEKE